MSFKKNENPNKCEHIKPIITKLCKECGRSFLFVGLNKTKIKNTKICIYCKIKNDDHNFFDDETKEILNGRKQGLFG